MKITPLKLEGAFTIDVDKHVDERGYFARAWCLKELAEAGYRLNFVQASMSFNARSGTVRGMHYQCPPGKEGKLVRCVAGKIYDALVDIRPDSETFLQHQFVELSAETSRAVFIPPGIAHGFQTLADSSMVFYEMTDYYRADQGSGFRFDDPSVGIEWPLPVASINERDRTYPDLARSQFDCFR